MQKKIISFFLIIILVLNISVCAYATTNSNDPFPTYTKTKEYLWQIVQDIGFIGTLPFKGIVELVNEIIHSKGISGEQDVTTEEEALDYVFDGISINGNGNIVLNDNAKLNINTLIDNYVNDNKYYVGYSLDMQYYPVPDYFKDFISSKQGTNYVFCRDVYNGTANGLRYEIFVVPKDNFDVSFVYYNSDYNVNGQYNQICASIFDNLTFQGVGILNNSNVSVYNVVCNSTASGYGQINDGGLSTRNIRFVSFLDNRYDYRYDDFPFGSRANQNGCILISNERIESYPIFGTYELFTSSQRGKMPYYYNNNVYTDFSSSVGDYTLTNDNSNHVTYGDITTYIDDHHTETGEYPSIPEINIWIESQPVPTPTPTPTPDNPSGSGSIINNNNPVINNNPNININLLPGDGTVSGNGTGGSSGIGNIFGFLSDIGKFLGDLIKNLGQALVDVIKGIGDLLNSIITELPTVFFDFLGAVFNWLPEDWVRLMGLSFACMLIVGVIKIFRR